MGRIVRKQRSVGEPQPRKLVNSWGYRPGRNSLRRKLSIRTLRKPQVTDALGVKGVESQTVSSDGLQRVTAGTLVPGTGARGTVRRKVQKMNTSPAKGTRIVKTPSLTNRGGVKNPFRSKRI